MNCDVASEQDCVRGDFLSQGVDGRSESSTGSEDGACCSVLQPRDNSAKDDARKGFIHQLPVLKKHMGFAVISARFSSPSASVSCTPSDLSDGLTFSMSTGGSKNSETGSYHMNSGQACSSLVGGMNTNRASIARY
jgi:hypothetical protein